MDISSLLKNLDKEKLEKLLSNPEIQEKAKNIDIGKLMEELRKNPEMLKELKKFF